MAPSAIPIVTAHDVRVSYGTGSPAEQDGLNGVSFAVTPGEFVAVIGPSGAGKTTLLRSLTGFVRPTAGHLVVAGIDVAHANWRQLRELRCNAATIPQHFNLVERLSAFDNVLMGRLGYVGTLPSLMNWFPRREQAAAYRLLGELGLAERALQRVDRLSGGERQRVAIARALAQEPQIMLADEPAASLDISLTRFVLDTLCRLNRDQGLTVVASLHDLRLAHGYASRILGLRQGRLVFDGRSAELSEASQREIYDGDEPSDTRFRGQQPTSATAAATG